jgi:hypothetical protein
MHRLYSIIQEDNYDTSSSAWKEVVTAYFKAQSKHLLGGTEENPKSLGIACLRSRFEPGYLGYEAEVVIQLQCLISNIQIFVILSH